MNGYAADTGHYLWMGVFFRGDMVFSGAETEVPYGAFDTTLTLTVPGTIDVPAGPLQVRAFQTESVTGCNKPEKAFWSFECPPITSSDMLAAQASANSLSFIVFGPGGLSIQEGQCVYISDEPKLPQMKALLYSSDTTVRYDWSVQVSYDRSGRHDSSYYHSNPLKVSDTFDIAAAMGTDIVGGLVIVRVKRTSSEKCEVAHYFYLRGYNPSLTTNTVPQYIASLAGSLWYDSLVAKHETGLTQGRRYAQFNERYRVKVAADSFVWEYIDPNQCTTAGIIHSPNASKDHGFGIFQLTNSPVPSAIELWNWKANVASGVSRLRSAQMLANTAMKRYRDSAWAMIGDSSAPDMIVTPLLILSDNLQYKPVHANALKRYNGLGTKVRQDITLRDFLSYYAVGTVWAWRPTVFAYRWSDTFHIKYDSNNYVADVCELYGN